MFICIIPKSRNRTQINNAIIDRERERERWTKEFKKEVEGDQRNQEGGGATLTSTSASAERCWNNERGAEKPARRISSS